jgi:hypothetical protein
VNLTNADRLCRRKEKNLRKTDSFRAAVWTSKDGGQTEVLTTPEDRNATAEYLSQKAIFEAERRGLDLRQGVLTVAPALLGKAELDAPEVRALRPIIRVGVTVREVLAPCTTRECDDMSSAFAEGRARCAPECGQGEADYPEIVELTSDQVGNPCSFYYYARLA